MTHWYTIQARANRAEILLYGDVAGSDDWLAPGVTAKAFLDELAALGNVPAIDLRINSPGGNVFAGMAIYNALKRHPARVTTHIDGVAASIASVIALAGNRVLIADVALMMIHSPLSMAGGNAKELRKTADLLDQVQANMLDVYASKMTLNRDAINELMDAETWFSAQEALDAGLADDIESGERLAAAVDLSRFKNSPRSIMPENTLSTESTTKTPELVATNETEILAREKTRRGDIRVMAKPFLQHDGVQAMVDQFLDDPAISPDTVGKKLLAHLGAQCEPMSKPHRIETGQNHGGIGSADYQAAVTDALLARNGVKVKAPHPAARDFSRVSLVSVAEDMLRQSGNMPRLGGAAAIIKAAISHTTSDFPSLLWNLAGRALMAGYENEPASHRQWCNFVTAPDFKTQTRVKLAEAPDLLLVNEGGEYEHGTMGDEAESYQLASYGRIFSITRQAIINDDLSAFTRLPQAFGQAGRRKEADLVYSILTTNGNMADGTALFHADHNNLLTAGALSIATLGEAKATLRKQTGPNGGLLNIVPRYLIVPAEMETDAEEIIASIRIKKSSGDEVENLEWVRNLELVVEPRLDEDSITAWYMAGHYMQTDTIECAHLDGNESIMLDEENGFDVAGVRVRATLDFAAKAIDWRGMLKNPGS